MEEENLKGTLVMVDPVFWDDPADRMGQIGVISGADTSRDDFYVRFDDKETALYGADVLLMLKSPDRLYEYAENHSATLSPEMLKDLHTIALIQEKGNASDLRAAMDLVQNDDNLTLYATDRLEESLSRNQSYKWSR